jgi:Right handed beta helix region
MFTLRLLVIVLMASLIVNCTKTQPNEPEPVLGQNANARMAAVNKILNVQTGKTYADVQKAFDELPTTFDRNYQIQISGRYMCRAVLQARDMGGFSLQVIGVGARAVLDAGGAESALSFNGGGSNVGNITLQNLEITNYSRTLSGTAGVRFTTVKGNNLLKNMLFTGGFAAMRATDKCGNITLEDVEMRNVRYGGPRFGLGVSAGQKDLGNIVFRRLKTTLDPSIPFPADDICALKGFESLLVEDCTFTGAAKSALSIYETSNIIIRRNVFRQANLTNTYSGSIAIQPADGGTCRNVVIENNLFDKCLGSALFAVVSNLKINNNTVIEGGTSRPIFSLEGCSGSVEIFNNLFRGNSGNRLAMILLYQMNAATVWKSDHNLYYKPLGNPRALIQGTVGAKNISGSELKQLQGLGIEAKSINLLPVFNGGTNSQRPYWMLGAVSPGRNAGNAAYFNRDLLGKQVSGTPDMGAYDFDSF